MNSLFIATSLDGYIADRDGGLGWLSEGAAAQDGDFGYAAFMDGIDAIVIGRTTFETVLGFGIDWPYAKPVFVLSRALTALPKALTGKAEILAGIPAEITATLAKRGHTKLYIDGGRVAQDFLAADAIDRMILTRVTVLLGGGTPLFGSLPGPLRLSHVHTETLARGLVQSIYERPRP